MTGKTEPARGGVFVGLMSGTSLDGISAAVVRFTERGARLQFELLAFRATPYTKEQRDRMLAAMNGGTAAEYSKLAFDFGAWLGEAAIGAIADAGISRSEILAEVTIAVTSPT